MPLANDLLEQAYHLARREPKRPRQASLRRAVSTSYYALFHLLISEATRNWKQSSQRATLGRHFKHGNMATASNNQKAGCNRFLTSNPPPAPGPDTDCMTRLQTVSFAFYQAYQQRQTADYDTVKLSSGLAPKHWRSSIRSMLHSRRGPRFEITNSRRIIYFSSSAIRGEDNDICRWFAEWGLASDYPQVAQRLPIPRLPPSFSSPQNFSIEILDDLPEGAQLIGTETRLRWN
jgi:uncharacterized protein (UPF0332 family)